MTRILGIERSLVRHRVVAALCEWVAAQEAADSEYDSAQRAMALDGRAGVARTTGIETTAGPEQRT